MGVSFDSGPLRKKFLAMARDVNALNRNALQGHGAFVERYAEDTRFAPYPGPQNERGGAGRKRLYSRTGALVRSIASRVKDESGGDVYRLRVTVGSGPTAKYVGIQEFGGVIKGKPWLTIPLAANKTAGGRTRFERGRQVPGGFILKIKGNLFIVSREATPGKPKGKLGFFFILKRSVRVPGRLRWREMIDDDRVVRDLDARLRNAVREGVSRHFGRSAL